VGVSLVAPDLDPSSDWLNNQGTTQESGKNAAFPFRVDRPTHANPDVTSLSVFSRLEVAQGKAVEGLKVQSQKSSGSGVCEHSFHLIGSDS
jgi:hypothetical protein